MLNRLWPPSRPWSPVMHSLQHHFTGSPAPPPEAGRCFEVYADLAGLELPPAVTAALTTVLALGAAYLRSNGDRGA